MSSGTGGRSSGQRRRERQARIHCLMELARWIEQHFKIGARPKIHSATEAEVIYANILKRLAAETP